MIRRLGFALLALATVGVIHPTTARAAIMIDNFRDNFLVTDNMADGTSVSNETSSQTSSIMGYRQFVASRTGPDASTDDPSDRAAVTLRSSAFRSLFSFDQSQNARGTGVINYDGQGGNTFNPSGFSTAVDLTQNGMNNAFVFRNLQATGNGLTLTVTLYSKSNPSITSTETMSLANNGGSPTDLAFRYADFTNPSVATNVGAISIMVDGRTAPNNTTGEGSDLVFNLIESSAVPEPSGIALALTGMVGMFGYRLRQRRLGATA